MSYIIPKPNYGTEMTVQEFKDAVKEGVFIGCEGGGRPMLHNMMQNVMVYPSNVEDIPKDATHIMWFNR